MLVPRQHSGVLVPRTAREGGALSLFASAMACAMRQKEKKNTNTTTNRVAARKQSEGAQASSTRKLSWVLFKLAGKAAGLRGSVLLALRPINQQAVTQQLSSSQPIMSLVRP